MQTIEPAHVFDGVDGHARHAHVPLHPRVVRVVAAVRGEVERHAQSLLARRYVVPVGLYFMRSGLIKLIKQNFKITF